MATRSTIIEVLEESHGQRWDHKESNMTEHARTHAHCSSKEGRESASQIPLLGPHFWASQASPVAVCSEPLPGWSGSVGSPSSRAFDVLLWRTKTPEATAHSFALLHWGG